MINITRLKWPCQKLRNKQILFKYQVVILQHGLLPYLVNPFRLVMQFYVIGKDLDKVWPAGEPPFNKLKEVAPFREGLSFKNAKTITSNQILEWGPMPGNSEILQLMV